MKRSNWIILGILLAASVLFLISWFYLGLDKVDAPLDLILVIVWWVVIAVACFGIHISEKKRQERIRTIYVGPGVLFNPEAGFVNTVQSPSVIGEMENILATLQYPFELQDFPKQGQPRLDVAVRTTVYQPPQEEQQADPDQPSAAVAEYLNEVMPSEPTDVVAQAEGLALDQRPEPAEWKGQVEVLDHSQEDPIPFVSRAELAAILRSVAPYAAN